MAVSIRTDLPFSAFSREADFDYILARLTNFLGEGFHSRAGFFAQQACEKYMKAILVQESRSYLQTHKLLELAGACASFNHFFNDPGTERILKNFDYFDQVGRYGPAANYDPLAQDSEGLRTAGVALWLGTYLGDLDAFVFTSRGMLDFAKINWDDGLKSILTRNRRSMMVSTWRGKPPIRVVLTKQNRYFRG